MKDKKIEIKHKVFQGTPDELELLLNEGWYIERVISSDLLEDTFYANDPTGSYKHSLHVVNLVIHLSRSEE